MQSLKVFLLYHPVLIWVDLSEWLRCGWDETQGDEHETVAVGTLWTHFRWRGFSDAAGVGNNAIFDFGTGLGTLTYFASGDTEFCTGLRGFQAQFTDWSFSNFAYTGPDNVTHSITGFTTYVDGLARAQGSCPATRAGNTITAQGTGYTIVITPRPGGL